MSEYKDTLNLPHTSFPMKASLPQREPAVLDTWNNQGIYKQIRNARKGAKRFVLHDGPPYANGHLHCGHALNKILKDIIIKSKSLSGYDAPFVPGWDCHGLPIELNVEKKEGKAGVKISAKDFRQKCREYAAQQLDIQRKEFKRLGVFGDWENPYITMDYSYEANIIRALATITANGHLQQGFKPVHWCIDCGSALAEAEVDYDDKTSISIDVAFLAVPSNELFEQVIANLPERPLIVPIWTTTPWTLPANEAVCLNPELEYALVDDGKRYFIVAKSLTEQVMGRYGIEKFTILKCIKGVQFEGLMLKHPLYSKEVPVVLGDHVTIDAGTGCVHTAPAHGPDDYEVGKRYKLPLINPVLGNGVYNNEVPMLSGMHALKSNQIIVDFLRERDVLLHEELMRHSYPHCWRHKTPVIFRATPQWFISMDQSDLRSTLMTLIDKVQWIPDWGKARIRLMIEQRPDWCISRQRAWGTPIPIFVHKTSKKPHPDTVFLLEKIATRIEQQGMDAWFDLEVEELLGEEAIDYEKTTDTLDVWFDSGVSHFCVLSQHQDLEFPADVYFEGSDQHRGWFNSSLTTAAAMYGQPPYKTVLTHGYTVDSEGKKLSKSKGNYVSLDKLVNQYGTDVLRLWVASTDYRNEVSISDEIVKRNADTYRRIRNTARFLLANLFDFDPNLHEVSQDHMVELDRWALIRCKQLQKDIIHAYDQYQFHLIYQKIHNFCATDLGSFYLDIIKDRQYTTPKDSSARRSCQTAMYHILHALTRWLSPILSFTAEEIWAYLPGRTSKSVFLERWYDAWPNVRFVAMEEWQILQMVRDEVNKALEQTRKKGTIGSALEAKVVLFANEALFSKLKRLDDELRFLLITSEAQVLSYEKRTQEAYVNESLGLAVQVEASTYHKCARCWHRCPEVGNDDEHPALCLRCVDNVNGRAELRQFA